MLRYMIYDHISRAAELLAAGRMSAVYPEWATGVPR